MIFLSLHPDNRSEVESIAIKLSEIYGSEQIFYDGWTDEPCQGITDKNVLAGCLFFFAFISKNTPIKKLAKLEWQEAIYKATNNKAILIPVKLDDCFIPSVLLQSLYLDFFGTGAAYGLRQMVDIINNRNISNGLSQTYENVRGYNILSKTENNELRLEVRAESYVEPVSKYLILLQHEEEELDGSCTNNVLIQQVFVKDIEVGENYKSNAIFFDIVRPTSPGFPIKFLIKHKTGKPLRFNGIMKGIAENKIRHIPIIDA